MSNGQQEQPTTAVAVRDEDRSALEQAPLIDSLNPRQLELLRALNPNLTDPMLAQGLELAYAYQLDPYAKEIWFAESKGQILVMVARDGLRKVLARNGLNMAGDVVREQDNFQRVVGEHGGHVVHTYGAQRGEIVGAWARVTDVNGTERGYFFAPIGEYRQDRGPWKKQVSVMALAAAERQAARQATPLSGVLVEGEDRLVRENERGALVSAGTAEMPQGVREVIERARSLGHVGLASVEAARMATDGVDQDRMEEWCVQAHERLDEFVARQAEEEQEELQDAEVIDDLEAEPTELERMAEQIDQLREDADALASSDPEASAELAMEADELQARMDALGSL